jgi:hypothetical protein
VGIGFDPEPNSMKGADIIACRISPTTGFGECRDCYAADVGMPLKDTMLNGESNIEEVMVIQENGFTTAMFTRPVEASDKWDKPILNGPTKVIFAFNPITNQFLYHGPTRSSSRMIDFFADYHSPTSVSLGLGVVAIFGIGLSIFMAILIAIKRDYFRYQAPTFCFLILAGTVFGYVAVILNLFPPSTVICSLQIWLWGISYMVVFGSLFGKVFRMWRIVNGAEKLKRVVIYEEQVLKTVGGLILTEILFLAIWTWFDTPHPSRVIFNGSLWSVCATNEFYWWIISLSYKGLMLFFGAFLAYQVRSLDSAINESKEVALSLYVMLLALGILVPIGYLLKEVPMVGFIVFSLGVSLPYIFLTGIIFGPTTLRIFMGKGKKKIKTISHIPKRSTVGTSPTDISGFAHRSTTTTTQEFESSPSVTYPTILPHTHSENENHSENEMNSEKESYSVADDEEEPSVIVQ